MRKDVVGSPAGKIEPGAVGQEPKAGGGKFSAPFAGEERVKSVSQRMQVEDIPGRVGDLGSAELVGAPVGQLLLLRDVDSEQVANEILEAMLIGVGAREARCDLGAVDRCRHDTESIAKKQTALTEKGEPISGRWVASGVSRLRLPTSGLEYLLAITEKWHGSRSFLMATISPAPRPRRSCGWAAL